MQVTLFNKDWRKKRPRIYEIVTYLFCDNVTGRYNGEESSKETFRKAILFSVALHLLERMRNEYLYTSAVK